MNLYKSDTYQADLIASLEATVGKENLTGKRFLITGATGTIGSFLVDMLVRYSTLYNAGITVYAAGRSLVRLEDRFQGIKTENLVFLEYDMTKAVEFKVSVDYVIHAAGNAYPLAFSNDPVGTIVGNIKGTYELLEYSRKSDVKRFLYISSGEVYGQGDLSLDEFEESYGGYVDPTSPRSCYPNSKRTAETLCVSYYKQYGLETLIVRPCHTYGPWVTANDNRANVQFIHNVLRGEDIILNSAGTQMRSYCYVADCASAIMTVLINGTAGEAYNSANPDARVTIADFAQIVAQVAGRKVVFANPTDKDVMERTPIEKQVLSSKKLENLGWQGRYSVPQGVANTLTILQGG
ncbi:MAG: NAD-dependent epimerase/dehydratase family protein [Oscillospiraceae bacterium]|nr:NAD-dependent epimerase/dehydratase family protein [Oscillospiraceae bacterium]